MSSALKVLVAEDEPSMLALVTRHLRTLGAQVIETSNGDHAWELAQEHRPDLVLLDVMMPGLSGWEICKRIKRSPEHAKTAVIMLTGIGEGLNEMTSPLFKADAWLNKPFEFAELDATLKRTLGEYDKALPGAAKTSSAARAKRAAKAAKKAAPAKAAKKAAPAKAAKKAAPAKAAKKAAKRSR